MAVPIPIGGDSGVFYSGVSTHHQPFPDRPGADPLDLFVSRFTNMSRMGPGQVKSRMGPLSPRRGLRIRADAYMAQKIKK